MSERNLTKDERVSQMAIAVAAIGELMEPVIEATAGYREHLGRAGYSPAIAERMAAAYHEGLLRMVMK